MRKASTDLSKKLDNYLAAQGPGISLSNESEFDAISGESSSLGVTHTTDSLNKDELEAALRQLEKF